VVLGILLLAWPYIGHFGRLLVEQLDYTPAGCYSQAERADCIPLWADEDRVTAYLLSHTQPDDYVFIGNQRHDRLFINDLLLHFLSGRRSPTRYTELHPGLANTQPIQEEIVADLEGKKVTVDYDPDQVSLDSVREAIEEEGYDVV
jgi:hypothetical protein